MTTKSKESNSTSKAKKKAKVKLKRAMKRRMDLRDVEEGDFRFLWAAYKMGAFEGLPVVDSPDEFVRMVMEATQGKTLALMWEHGNDKPVGLFVMEISGHQMEPHVYWMPWTSDRNKIVGTLAFFKEMNQDWAVITTITEANKDFYYHIRKYGTIREVGVSRNYYGINKAGYIFEGVM